MADFVAKLEAVYAAHGLEAAWPNERPAIERIMPALVAEIQFNYAMLDPVGVGGSGIIVKVCDKNLESLRALKFARPVPGSESRLTELLLKETDKLRDLVHPNLIRIFARGGAYLEGRKVPYYIMDFMTGTDAAKYLRTHPTEDTLLAIVRGAIAGLSYMHANRTIHLDIKPGNIFVGSNDDVRLADLGFAKRLSSDKELTPGAATLYYMHPDFVLWRVEPDEQQEPSHQPALFPRDQVKEAWDLYSLGRTIKTLIEIIDQLKPRALSPYTRRYLRLMFCRLLDGRNDPDEQALGLSANAFAEIKFVSATDVVADFEKLSGAYNLDARVPELAAFMEEMVQASPFGAVPFTRRVAAIVNQPHLRNLAGFTQLGLLSVVYPTATHTRLEHSLGTFAVLTQYLRALYSDPVNPLFKQIMTEEDLRAALVAGLLHDVGHYPLAHDLEEADPATFSHEARGLAIIRSDRELQSLCERPEKPELKAASDGVAPDAEPSDGPSKPGWEVTTAHVASILEARPEEFEGTLKDRILHSLIDGPIDADKVDYLTRDSSRLDLPFGSGIDYDRLLRTLTIVATRDDERTSAALGIHEKGKIAAESVAFARYCMYGAVYWQHTYRAIKAMINRLTWEVLRIYCGGDLANPPSDYRSKARVDLNAYLRQRLMATYQLGFEEQAARPVPSVAGQAECLLIEWLASRSGSQGQVLASCLLGRELYGRALVVSESREDKLLKWDRLEAIFKSKAPWRRKLRLSELVQDKVRTALRDAGRPHVELTGVTPSGRDKFLASAADTPLILLDYPPGKPGSVSGLGYLREDDRVSAQSGEVRMGDVGESEIWLALGDKARPSIAKLRLYCHPEYVRMLVAYLKRPQLEDCVKRALDQLVEGPTDEADEDLDELDYK